MQTSVAIRADGSDRFGMGHVMRCVAIAQALKASGTDVTFVTKKLPGDAAAIVRAFGFEVSALPGDLDWRHDAAATIEAVRSCSAHLMVIDLNHAGTLADERGFVEFLVALRKAGLILTVMEGLDAECISMRRPLPAAAIVVPYLNADKREYDILPGSVVFAGTQYVPLRSNFNGATLKAIAPVARRILVSLGGGDVAQYQSRVVDALAALDHDLDLRVTGQLDIEPAGRGKVEILGRTANMAALIDWADLAIIGSGLTRYETAALGTPSLSFSLRAEHAPILEESAAEGFTEHGGVLKQKTQVQIADAAHRLIVDAELRARMSRRGLCVVDGQGASRLATGIRALAT